MIRAASLAVSLGLVYGNVCSEDQCTPPDFGKSCCCGSTCQENKYGTVTELEPGLWTLNTKNDAAAANVGPPRNRAVIFKIPDGKEENVLVLVNGVGLCNTSLAGLKALEVSEKAPLRHVVTTGDWHHVYLKDYRTSFPDATIHVPPGRIPGLDKDAYKYTLLSVDEPLASLRPHLQMYPMQGLGQPFQLDTPRYEFFTFHLATKTLVAGDIVFYFTCSPPVGMDITMPGLEARKIHFWNAAGSSMFKNRTAGAESAKLMLDLDFDRFLSVHGELGSQVPPGASPSAKELMKVAMTTGGGPMSGDAEEEVLI